MIAQISERKEDDATVQKQDTTEKRMLSRKAGAAVLLLVALARVADSDGDVGNIALMPRVPPTYALVDWRARAGAFVDRVLSSASAGAGTTEFYNSSSAGPSLGRGVFDVATYVGAPPKRESFPPLETLLTAAALGRRLDSNCSASLDDCVATALQYARADGVIGHWVAPAAGGGPTVIAGGDLWDSIYSGTLVASLASEYPLYGGGALGPPIVLNALKWHSALMALGGADALDMNISGFDFGMMAPITDPPIYRQPSSSAGIAWLALAAREWQRYENATAPPLPELQEAIDWSLAYLDRLGSGFFENLLGLGALAAARENAERNTTYDVARMLGLAFQDGSKNQKHGWGVFVDVWGGLDVSGLVGFISEWDPSQPFGAGGGEAYFGDALWLAASVAPVARYNASLAHSVGRFLVNVCSASRLFFPDALPADQQTDFGDARNVGGVFPYEALRSCDYVRELESCLNGTAAPFATGDYGCEYATGSPRCADPAPPCTNLAGYGGASVGVLASLCAPTNVRAVLQADLLATDRFHAPARPAFLVYNPHAETICAEVAVPGCALVHFAAEAPAATAAAAGLCAVTDKATGRVLARGVAPGASASIDVPPDTALVIELVPDAAPAVGRAPEASRASSGGVPALSPPVVGAATFVLDGADWIANSSAAGVLISASVPGEVASDLEAAGLIGDPLALNNTRGKSPLWDSPFTYTKTFATPGGAAWAGAADVLLVLESVKMVADVFVNGAALGDVRSQFVRRVVSVGRLLNAPGGDTNELRVELPRASEDARNVEGRYMSASGAWDWAPWGS